MCSMLGLYPWMGHDHYMLSTPYFQHATIHLPQSGAELTITTDHPRETHPHIQSAILNGKTVTEPWLSHGQLILGGHLELKLSEKEA